MKRTGWMSMLIVALSCLATGCGPYQLSGQVIEGAGSHMIFVAADDPRLDEPGISDVEVKIYRDPTRPNSTLSSRTITSSGGRFIMPLEAFGAGWMEEKWRITARRRGFLTADTMIALPRAKDGQVLLITLTPGRSTPDEADEDLLDQYERYR